jgi:hypothetical protein
MTARRLALLLCAAATACTNLPTAVADDDTHPSTGEPEPIEIVVQEHIQVSD